MRDEGAFRENFREAEFSLGSFQQRATLDEANDPAALSSLLKNRESSAVKIACQDRAKITLR